MGLGGRDRGSSMLRRSAGHPSSRQPFMRRLWGTESLGQNHWGRSWGGVACEHSQNRWPLPSAPVPKILSQTILSVFARAARRRDRGMASPHRSGGTWGWGDQRRTSNIQRRTENGATARHFDVRCSAFDVTRRKRLRCASTFAESRAPPILQGADSSGLTPSGIRA